MLVFAQVFVAFLSQGDNSSNVPRLLIFTYVSFSRCNLPLAIFPNRYSVYQVYQNSHYLRRSC